MWKCGYALVLGCLATLYSSLPYAEGSATAEEKNCRCRPADGPCTLSPIVQKSTLLAPIEVSKTKEKDYSLSEKTKIIQEKVTATVEQGGCSHMYVKFVFEFNDKTLKTDYRYFLDKTQKLISAVSKNPTAKEVVDAIQTGKSKLKVRGHSKEKGINDPAVEYFSENPYSCDLPLETDAPIVCMFSVMENFSHVEWTVQKAGDNVRIEATEITAL